MSDFICPKCDQPSLPSIYLPMCTGCANIERRKSGEIKDDIVIKKSSILNRAVEIMMTLWRIHGSETEADKTAEEEA